MTASSDTQKRPGKRATKGCTSARRQPNLGGKNWQKAAIVGKEISKSHWYGNVIDTFS